jgi:hypothetical protein
VVCLILNDNNNWRSDMAKIGILTCSNATQDLGCSSVSCLANLRKRKGAFADYHEEETLTLKC